MLEGIVYNLNVVLDALRVAVDPITSIRATGGFARSELWRQMLADIFNQEVVVPESYESSCFGAAMLGLYALERLPSLEHASSLLGETHRHRPISENVKQYQQVIPLYNHLLKQFRPMYAEMARVQETLAEDKTQIG